MINKLTLHIPIEQIPGTIQGPVDSVKYGQACELPSTQLVSAQKEDALKREVSLVSAILPTKK